MLGVEEEEVGGWEDWGDSGEIRLIEDRVCLCGGWWRWWGAEEGELEGEGL